MRVALDKIDRKLVKLLSTDAREGANQIATRLELSPPTVRARLKSLIEQKLLKIAGLVNVSERPELTVAILGINAYANGRLDEVARKISELPFVTSVSIVTGRYDLICEVMFEGDMDALYRVTSELLPGLAEPGVIRGSETFVVMKSHNKWLSLPKGVWDSDLDPADDRQDQSRRPQEQSLENKHLNGEEDN
ncbi:Lrp/AsnC family transcriptional regulator [Tianweitania sp. BSSL-BM11]|uniref:Lrp/AsnC family transcriptional regulator n=1 Tax=Tianweitania aestuarii TaxID=2814886 RepID=A0ABS5RVU9_9HYPH|nr:Lrp/AsnC family transcriptional regulator [Tianweitania aestuarii]MBS9721151.1 Lrp/AsnC family transcriptional regulator [Tianweitania aestuarii]